MPSQAGPHGRVLPSARVCSHAWVTLSPQPSSCLSPSAHRPIARPHRLGKVDAVMGLDEGDAIIRRLHPSGQSRADHVRFGHGRLRLPLFRLFLRFWFWLGRLGCRMLRGARAAHDAGQRQRHPHRRLGDGGQPRRLAAADPQRLECLSVDGGRHAAEATSGTALPPSSLGGGAAGRRCRQGWGRAGAAARGGGCRCRLPQTR